MNKILKRAVPAIVAFAALASATGALADSGGGGVPGPNNLFITSAVEHPGGTVTLPLRRGVSHGQTVYYVITDVSDGNVAAQLGVNKAAKLANASGSGAVEKVSIVNGVVNFPATVDFSPVRQLTAGPTGFPPATAQPGAIGRPGYSPLIELPNGTVENAPQIANASGQADKVVSIDPAAGTVTYRETAGFQGGKPLLYASFDSSNPVAAAIEDVTYARRSIRRRQLAMTAPPRREPAWPRLSTARPAPPTRSAEFSPWRCGLFAPIWPLTNAARLARDEAVLSSPIVGAELSDGA